jgi:tetratricopeptide (TPR) repeat protein
MASRLEILEQYYKEDPNDPFNIYALALELQKNDAGQTLYYFDLLLSQHPSYIPVYYHAGKLYQELGEKNKAIDIFESGIRQAQIVGDMKALRELRSALDELMFE